MKKLIILFFFQLIAFSFILKAPAVLASTMGPDNVNYGNTSNDLYYKCASDELATVFGCVPKGKDSLPIFIQKIFNWVAGIIATLAVLGLIYAGYTYTTSGGNPDSIKKAKDIVVTSISSVLIIIFSWALFRLIGAV